MSEGKNYQKLKEIFNGIEGVELNDSKKGTFRFYIYPDMKEMNVGIDALNLSVRSSNCLMRAKIMTSLFIYQLSCLNSNEKEEYINKVIKMNSDI